MPSLHFDQVHSALFTFICKNPLYKLATNLAGPRTREEAITGCCLYTYTPDEFLRFWPVDPHCHGKGKGWSSVEGRGIMIGWLCHQRHFHTPVERAVCSVHSAHCTVHCTPYWSAHANSIAVTGGHILPIHYFSPDLFGSFQRCNFTDRSKMHNIWVNL